MKKEVLTITLIVLTITTAFAQKSESRGKQKRHQQLMMTLTSQGVSKTDSIKYASYSIDRVHPDTLAHQPMVAEINVGLNHLNHFFIKAASGGPSKTIALAIVFYDSTGKVVHEIQAKEAYITYVTSAMSNSSGGIFLDYSLTIKSPVLSVDGIKM